MGISFVISLNNPLFKNMPYVGCFWHFIICWICVFCICVLYCLTQRNIIFDILEQSSFQKYGTCWVFLALRHMLYLCICVFVYLWIWIFVFLYLHVWHMEMLFLISLNNPIFKNMPQVGRFWHLIICCIFVCVYLYFCICMFDTWEYDFCYQLGPLFFGCKKWRIYYENFPESHCLNIARIAKLP